SWLSWGVFLSFFFQAEDGIRDFHVTGVQTCALPIYRASRTTVRLTPNWRMSADSVGSFSPGRICPPRMRSEKSSTSPCARLRGRRGVETGDSGVSVIEGYPGWRRA